MNTNMKKGIDVDRNDSGLALRRDGPNQFNNFDRAMRASLSISKEAVLTEEARVRKLRARQRAKKTAEFKSALSRALLLRISDTCEDGCLIRLRHRHAHSGASQLIYLLKLIGSQKAGVTDDDLTVRVDESRFCCPFAFAWHPYILPRNSTPL